MNIGLHLNTKTFVAAAAASVITLISSWAFIDATRVVRADVRPSAIVMSSTSSHGNHLG